MRVVCTRSVVGNPTLERKVVQNRLRQAPFARGVFFRSANSLKTLEVLRAFLLRMRTREKEKEKEKQKVKQE